MTTPSSTPSRERRAAGGGLRAAAGRVGRPGRRRALAARGRPGNDRSGPRRAAPEGPVEGGATRAGEGDRAAEHRLRHPQPPRPRPQLEPLHAAHSSRSSSASSRATSPPPTAGGSTTTATRRSRSSATARRRTATGPCRPASCAAAARTTSSWTTACGRRTGEWKVIDVIIEQVSLVANFRSQFQEIVGSGGPEKLLQVMRDKTAKGEEFKS